MYSILFTDDEKDFRGIIDDYMTAKGFTVYVASDGDEAVRKAKSNKPDAVIMDVLMPNMSGYRACKLIKEMYNDIPIIFMSALGNERDLLEGYKSGADDYVIKPFPLSVLYEKILLLINKSKNLPQNNIITYSGISLNLQSHKVFSDGEELALASKDYEILKYLLMHKDVVVSRETLINRVWGYDFYGDDRVVDTHIKIIRKALKNKADTIKTVINNGYRFEEIEL